MNCMIAQSGGPTVAINASLAGVLKANEATKSYDKIYGALNGIVGVLHHNFLELTSLIEEEDNFIDRLIHTPAMYLGSCRYKIPSGDEGQEIYRQVFEVFEEYQIGAFFYIGGNDSMDTVDKLSKYGASINSSVRIVGIPKTIDNDLVTIDHTPGFGSAAKYVATSVREVAWDAYIYAVPSVTIIEIMGRDAGWLTAAAALARTEDSPAPDRIYLPEVAFDLDAVTEDVRNILKEKNTVVLAISEGIRDKNGEYISTTDGGSDIFGHNHLSGAGKTLEHLLKEALGVKVRSIEINVLQRCASHLASRTDLEESVRLGETAHALALAGKTAVMASVKRVSGTGFDGTRPAHECVEDASSPYQVAYTSVPVSLVANQVKSVPREWINAEGNDVTDAMVNYLRPLIAGEPHLSYTDGLANYLSTKHLYHVKA